MSTYHIAIMSTCHFVNLSFYQLAILSTCRNVNLSFCQLAEMSTILSTCHNGNFQFWQLVVSWSYHFVRLMTCWLAIVPIWCFIKLQFFQLTILSTCYAANPRQIIFNGELRRWRGCELAYLGLRSGRASWCYSLTFSKIVLLGGLWNNKLMKQRVDKMASYQNGSMVRLVKHQVDDMIIWLNVKLTKPHTLTKQQVDEMISWSNVN